MPAWPSEKMHHPKDKTVFGCLKQYLLFEVFVNEVSVIF
jgi:hypothetical protein